MLTAIKETWKSVCKVYELFSKAQKQVLLVAIAMMAVAGALAATPPLLVGWLVDGMLDARVDTFGSSLPYLSGILAVIIGNACITVVRKWMVEDLCTRVQKDQTERIIGHLLRVNLSVFNNDRLGAINGRLHRSIEGLIRLIKLGFLQFFPAVACACFALIVAVSQQLVISIVMFGSVITGIAIVLCKRTANYV